MISYLQIENLTKSYGDRLLFDSVTFGVNQGDKIGLIAKNGTGKTTLLRIISGQESPDSGSVIFRNDLKVGIVDQTPEFAPDDTVIQACMQYDTAAYRSTNRLCQQAIQRLSMLQFPSWMLRRHGTTTTV